jgi:hypothetical protein
MFRAQREWEGDGEYVWVSGQPLPPGYAAAEPAFRPLDVRPRHFVSGAPEPRMNVPLLVESWRDLREWWRGGLVLAGRCLADGSKIVPKRRCPSITVRTLLHERPSEQHYALS